MSAELSGQVLDWILLLLCSVFCVHIGLAISDSSEYVGPPALSWLREGGVVARHPFWRLEPAVSPRLAVVVGGSD